MSYMDVLIFNFLKNRIMEIFIYCYLTVSYLVMIGYDNAIREYEGYSLKNKEEAAVLVLIVLSAPAILPFIIGGILYKLLKR